MSDNKTSSNGIGFTGALLIAFIVLKLCNVITWSWWWVLSPAWIGVAILILIVGACLVVNHFRVRKIDKVINEQGQIISKWEQRLAETRKAQAKANAERNQRALDEKMTKNKGDEFRSQNIV